MARYVRGRAKIALAAQSPDAAAAQERYREAKALAGALEMRPSWRIATSASVDCPSVRATARRPCGTLPSRRRCAERWICGSGWSRRRETQRVSS